MSQCSPHGAMVTTWILDSHSRQSNGKRVMDEHAAIRMASDIIKRGDYQQLTELYEEVIRRKLDHAYILQKSYLNACVYGNPECIRTFFRWAHACSEVDKIRIRPAFLYSKYIVRNVPLDELNMLIQELYPIHMVANQKVALSAIG